MQTKQHNKVHIAGASGQWIGRSGYIMGGTYMPRDVSETEEMFPTAAAFLDAQELYMDQDSSLPAYGEGDFAM